MAYLAWWYARDASGGYGRVGARAPVPRRVRRPRGSVCHQKTSRTKRLEWPHTAQYTLAGRWCTEAAGGELSAMEEDTWRADMLHQMGRDASSPRVSGAMTSSGILSSLAAWPPIDWAGALVPHRMGAGASFLEP
jgi:hypothetical protein